MSALDAESEPDQVPGKVFLVMFTVKEMMVGGPLLEIHREPDRPGRHPGAVATYEAFPPPSDRRYRQTGHAGRADTGGAHVTRPARGLRHTETINVMTINRKGAMRGGPRPPGRDRAVPLRRPLRQGRHRRRHAALRGRSRRRGRRRGGRRGRADAQTRRPRRHLVHPRLRAVPVVRQSTTTSRSRLPAWWAAGCPRAGACRCAQPPSALVTRSSSWAPMVSV